jgi:hypothetical protein
VVGPLGEEGAAHGCGDRLLRLDRILREPRETSPRRGPRRVGARRCPLLRSASRPRRAPATRRLVRGPSRARPAGFGRSTSPSGLGAQDPREVLEVDPLSCARCAVEREIVKESRGPRSST